MNYFFSFLALLLSLSSIAQRQICGHQIHQPTSTYLDYEHCATPSFRSEWMHKYHQNPAAYQNSGRSNSATTYLPLSLHIVGDDDSTGYASLGTVLNAFCQVNRDYKSTGIQFFIEFPIHYIENSAFNEHDSVTVGGGFMLQYNIPNTTNCYIVTRPVGSCGYNVPYGGLALGEGCLSNNPFSHELGHALGLQHTFAGWEGGPSYGGSAQQVFPNPAPTIVTRNNTLYRDTMWNPADTMIIETIPVEYVTRTGANANCNVAADGFCDTPADYLSFGWGCNGSGMSNIQQLDPDSVPFHSNGANIMSYANCRTTFSAEQAQYMDAYIQAKRSSHLYNQSPIVDSISISNVTLIEPAANAVLPSTNGPTFRWNKVDGATHYLLKVCTGSCTVNSTIEEILLTDTFYVSSLTYTPRLSFLPYQWRVYPFNQTYTCAGYSLGNLFNTQVTTGTNTISTVNRFSIYPNPSQKGRTLQLELQTSKAITGQFKLLTIAGKQLVQENWALEEGTNQVNLPMSNLVAGVYLVYFESENDKIVRKLIIEQ